MLRASATRSGTLKMSQDQVEKTIASGIGHHFAKRWRQFCWRCMATCSKLRKRQAVECVSQPLDFAVSLIEQIEIHSKIKRTFEVTENVGVRFRDNA